jgi:deoxyribodipyrimidine photo-lyase
MDASGAVLVSDMGESVSIVWFRNDLRLGDHPALNAALSAGDAVVPIFIWSPETEGDWAPGAASRVWLHESLTALSERLVAAGSRLVLRVGDPRDALPALVRETGAERVFWNRRYEPHLIAIDADVKARLKADGVAVESFPGNLLFEPWTIQNKQGEPYKVFTPFWRTCEECLPEPRPFDAPKRVPGPKSWPKSETLDALELRPEIRWDTGIRTAWRPGEAGAAERLRHFLDEAVDTYKTDRDFPARDGVSRLSPHLHFGEVSPRQILAAVRSAGTGGGAEFFVRELGWREFAHHVLYHFPETPEQPLQEAFTRFKWRRSKKDLEAWQRGRTGYPIVDAGMRELWETGYMHNRVRMIVASFLVKDLMIGWREGRAGFGTRWWTRTLRTTPWVGSGPGVAARTPRRIFGSLIR